MDKNLENILVLYVASALSGNIVACTKLLSIFIRARKNSEELIYKKDLSSDSKYELCSNYVGLISDLFEILKISLIPYVGCLHNVVDVYDLDEEYYKFYLKELNETINRINEFEESERKGVASSLKTIYEEFPGLIPDTYKGCKLEDETIRISMKECQKFLKKYGVYFEIKYVDKEDVDEYTYKLKKNKE